MQNMHIRRSLSELATETTLRYVTVMSVWSDLGYVFLDLTEMKFADMLVIVSLPRLRKAPGH